MAELSAMDIDGLRGALEAAFQNVDVERSGQLSLPQVIALVGLMCVGLHAGWLYRMQGLHGM